MSTDKDTTDKNDEAQDKLISALEKFATAPPTIDNTLKFPEIAPREYDLDIIDNFLNHVFHADLETDENILTWMVTPTRSPSYPKPDHHLLEILEKTRKPKALYYATATCRPDTDKKLYHRKKLFCSLRVVVLDDIGTKIPLEKIPKDFPPSYIIESSEGNFQYGYILDAPVTDLPAAEALIQLVYESGYSDEGGKTPVKLVRLPEGVNGKKGDKGPFVSKLTSLTDTLYSPQQILDALELNVKWEEVLADADDVTKRRASKSLGTSPWADIKPQSQALNGFIDPVLEWLYETNQVVHDNEGEWVEILCPNSEKHTSGSATAGYAPIGRGEELDTRGFHCFHDNCASYHTRDFLGYVAIASGIQAGSRDPSAQLTSRYVFDKVENAVWDIKSDRRDIKLGMSGFATLHPHKTSIHTIEGKEKYVGMTSLWTTSPSRVVVAGATYNPATTARIVDLAGERYINLFTIPNWGHGPIDMLNVQKFKNYLEYLIPEKLSRDYFLMWLAAKCQDMSFRGAALVMVAQKQGVGRSTLADMIKTLVGATNVADVPLTQMVGASDFNEWQEKPFIVCEETLSGDPAKFYNTYEKLKTLIDPRSRTITINPKFGLKREVECFGSYLFLTNHTNAIALMDGDRRFFVMDNARIPAKPSVFTQLNEWLGKTDTDGLPTWGRSVFRWLQDVDVDIEYLTAPPPTTQAKRDMAKSSMGDMDFAVKVLLDLWPDPYINASEVYTVFRHPILAGPIHFDEDTTTKHISRMVNRNSMAYTCGTIPPELGSSERIRPRLMDNAQDKGYPFAPPTGENKPTRQALQDHYFEVRNLDLADLATQVMLALKEDDRI